jgi:hypothetical protein
MSCLHRRQSAVKEPTNCRARAQMRIPRTVPRRHVCNSSSLNSNSLLHNLQARPCEVEVMRDVAGLALNDELHGTFARSAGRKVLATNDDSIMIGSVFLMYHAVDAGNGSHLAGKVGATKASGRSGGTHWTFRCRVASAVLRFAKNESTVAHCSDGLAMPMSAGARFAVKVTVASWRASACGARADEAYPLAEQSGEGFHPKASSRSSSAQICSRTSSAPWAL